MILYIFPEAGLVLFMSLYQWVGIAEITILDVFSSHHSGQHGHVLQLLEPCW